MVFGNLKKKRKIDGIVEHWSSVVDAVGDDVIQYNTIFVYFELTKRSSTRETECNTYI